MEKQELHFDLSLKTRFLLFFSLLLLVIGGVFAYIAIDSIRLDWAESEMDEKYELAQTEAGNISTWIASEARATSHIADSIKFNPRDVRAASMELKAVSDLLSRSGSEPGILVICHKGKIIYQDNPTEWDQASLAKVREIEAKLSSNKIHDPETQPFYVFPLRGKFLFIVSKRTSDGKLVGIFNILLKYNNGQFETSTHFSKASVSWHILPFDSIRSYRNESGTLRASWWVWRMGPRELLSKEGGYFVRSDGIACGYALIPHTDSYVAIFDPVPGFDTAVRNLERLHIGFGAIALLIILSFSFYLSNTVVRPIEALREGVESLRNDNFSEVSTEASGEIGELVGSFNEMGRLLQNSRKELRALSDFSSSLISDVRDEDVCLKVAKAVAEAFEVEAVVVSLAERDMLIPRATVGIADELLGGFTIQVGEGLLGTVFKDGHGMIINDLSNDPRVKHSRFVREQHLHKFAGVPLSVQDKNIGVLAVLNPRDNRSFNKSDLYLLSTFAGQAAIKIRNHDLFEELENDMERIQQLQAGLVHSEKLAAVGQLVSGVAHELNNPLGVILGYGNLASKKSTDKTMSDYLSKIESAAERAASIVKNLLTFSRKREVSHDAISLNDVVRSVCDLVHPQFVSNNITLRLNLGQTLPETTGDFQQLQQVFLNLITNSIHAMEEKGGGKIVISTFQEDSNLVATVTDDGKGISPENLPKVFEPFFTTKPVGKGTGLGLSLCYGIIKQHGGEITVQSLPGKGSIFIVEIPINKIALSQEPVPAQTIIEKVAHCRVLVVEDEPAMRALLKDSLEEHGCTVITASNGKEAMQILETTEVDIILSDLKMPEMDGKEFYTACISKHPGYKDRFIFSSGDTASKQTNDFLKNTHCEVLLKPFSTDQLLQKLLTVKEHAEQAKDESGNG